MSNHTGAGKPDYTMLRTKKNGRKPSYVPLDSPLPPKHLGGRPRSPEGKRFMLDLIRRRQELEIETAVLNGEADVERVAEIKSKWLPGNGQIWVDWKGKKLGRKL